MALPDDVLYLKAEALLEAIVADYAARSATPPERQFVTVGGVALDCSTLAVTISRVVVGFPNQPTDGLVGSVGDMAQSVELQAIVARCIPTVDLSSAGTPDVPTPEALETSAGELAVDGWVFAQGIREAVAGGLFEPCADVVLDDVIPIENSGGVGGWTRLVRVQL